LTGDYEARLSETPQKVETGAQEEGLPAKIDSATKPLQEEINKLKGDLASAKEKNDERINQLASQANDSLVTKDIEWQKRLDAQREEYEKKLAEGKAGTVETVAQGQEETQTQMEEAEKKHRQELEKQKQTYERELVSREGAWQEKIASLQDELLQQKQEWQEKVNEDVQGKLSQFKERDDTLLALKAEISQREQKIGSLENSINTLREELRSAKTAAVSSDTRLVSTSRPAQQTREAQQAEQIKPTGEESLRQYYSEIRNILFGNIQKTDLSRYKGKAQSVKIVFELSSNGLLKGEPKFYGVSDDNLKAALYKCFKDALPFPAFPEGLKRDSQYFTISILFGSEGKR